MKPSDFVERLAAAAPSIAELEKDGCSRVEANKFRKSFECVERSSPLGERESDELVGLLNGWDASSVQIGMVHFFDKPLKTPRGFQVGEVEADPLMLAKSGEVLVEELHTHGHQLWLVAENGGKCLDALIIAAPFLAKCATREIDFEDFEAARAVAAKCTLAAGGEKYRDFYTMLLGAEP